MAAYAIGDVQGCYDELRRLLDTLSFDPVNDQLWLCGDLVNRGPDSLSVLRFVRGLGDSAVTVLGNHDVHLLARVHRPRKLRRRRDTLEDILNAPDAAGLIDWLRFQPLLHHDALRNFVMVHAGLLPEWDLPTAAGLAGEVESVLRADNWQEFLHDLYEQPPPRRWRPDLSTRKRRRFTTAVFTRLRYCTADGQPDYRDHGQPGSQHADLLPWFRHPQRANAQERIVFGHWSTLGTVDDRNVFPLDEGCVWGGCLAALHLDDTPPRRTRLQCQAAAGDIATQR